jgi:hypothetical protein
MALFLLLNGKGGLGRPSGQSSRLARDHFAEIDAALANALLISYLTC